MAENEIRKLHSLLQLFAAIDETGCDQLINATHDDGCTLLHASAAHGDTQTVLLLIRLGAKKGIVAGARGTPLHQAAAGGHVLTLKAMLKAGCPVNLVDSNGGSIMHAAALGVLQ